MKQPRGYSDIRLFPDKKYSNYLIRGNDSLNEVELSKDEIEAINLMDAQGFSKKKASKKMGISQKDFEKIINEARKKVAKFLSEGNTIKVTVKEENITVEEDLSEIKACKFRCATCGYIYYVKYEFQDIICPKCNSKKVMTSEDAGFCKNWSLKK
ncbi:DUF134 domain-containing protein [Romboutsia sp. CE17]|uniref:DUF134 domain-containing protein n=1 Tax=Romboutsia sp. CE17 TaxID=2724150 RepID=UPI001442CBB6|nr:DUF134 domain-containing protein [Romboutsia sp. CE17]QJA07822.1 DUF134 domain-containing protein [Romboutsia sp. CE17]